jgi:putative phosphoribosyl transferase
MFNDRVDAGKQLAKKLENYKENKDVLVLGIPRGGIVVANEIAKSLDAALDVITIKKIGAPENE